jgi:hypothetical protein
MEVVKKSVARGLVDASSNLRVKRASGGEPALCGRGYMLLASR